MTLVEVLGALALLAIVLVALLTARSQATRQSKAAQRRIDAAKVADELLAIWWLDPERNLSTERDGEADHQFRWRTRFRQEAGAAHLGLRVLRLEITDGTRAVSPGDTNLPLVDIDLVVPEPKVSR